jgi:hypothetical protein
MNDDNPFAVVGREEPRKPIDVAGTPTPPEMRDQALVGFGLAEWDAPFAKVGVKSEEIDNPFAEVGRVAGEPMVNPMADIGQDPELPKEIIQEEIKSWISGQVDAFAMANKGWVYGLAAGARHLNDQMARMAKNLASTFDAPEQVGKRIHGDAWEEWKKEKFGDVDEKTELTKLAEWLKARSEVIMPTEWAIANAPTTLVEHIQAGVGAAPGIIAELALEMGILRNAGLPSQFTGPAGFSFSEMLLHSEDNLPEQLAHGAKGWFMGRAFDALRPLAVHNAARGEQVAYVAGSRGLQPHGPVTTLTGAAALGGGMAAAEGGGPTEITAGAISLAGLLSPAAFKANTPAQFKTKIKPATEREVSPLKEAFEPFSPVSTKHKIDVLQKIADTNNQLQQVRTQLRSKKIDSGTKEALRTAREDLKVRLNEQKQQLNEINAAQVMESNIRSTIAHAKRIADMNGTDPRYELFKILPKLAPEYKVPDPIEIASNLRAGSKDPGALIIDPLSLRHRLIDIVKTGVDDAGRVLTDIRRKEADISQTTAYVEGRLVPGKFMAKNSLLKWTVDTLAQLRIRTENTINQLKYGASYTEGWGLTALRSAIPRPTRAGGISMWDTLSRKSQRKVLDALIANESRGRTADTSDAALRKNFGLTPDQIQAYRGIRTMNDRALQLINETITKYRPDLKPIEALPNWLVHSFTGNFRIFARDAQGNLIQAFGAHTKPGANMLVKRLKKQFPDLEFTKPINSADAGYKTSPDLQVFSLVMMHMGSKHPLSGVVSEAYGKMLQEGRFMKHGTERQGVGGWAGSEPGTKGVKNFERATHLFIDGAVKWAHRQQADAMMNPIFTDSAVAGKYPNSLSWAKAYKDNALGQPGQVTKVVDKVLGDFIGTQPLSSFFGAVNKAALYARLFRPAFLPSQIMQPLLTVPRLQALKHEGIKGSVTYAIGKSFIDFIIPSKNAKDSIRFAVRTGDIAPKFAEAALGHKPVTGGISQAGITGRAFGKSVFEYLSFERAVARLEEGSRSYSNLLLYNYYRSAGVSHARAVKDAAYFTGKGMVEYTNYERPMLFTEGGAGVIGKPFGLFQTFKFNHFAHLIEYARLAKRTGDFTPLTMLIGAVIASAGVQGVIGAGEYNALAKLANNTLGTKWPTIEELLIKHNASDLVVYGAPSALLGIDVSTTMSAPAVVSEPFWRAPGLEYVGTFSLSGMKLMAREAAGVATDLDYMQFWKDLAPTYIQGYIEAYYTNKMHGKITGVPVPQATKHGAGHVKRDLHDWYSRMMGARSLKESREVKAIYEMSRIEKEASNTNDIMVDLIAYSIVTGGASPDFAYEKLLENGVMPPAIADRVRARIITWDTTVMERAQMAGGVQKQLLRQPIIGGLQGDVGNVRED